MQQTPLHKKYVLYDLTDYKMMCDADVINNIYNNMAAAADKKEQEMLQEIQSYNRKKDYYEILGLSKQATEPDIKKAYRKLALRFHPDKNQYAGAKDVFKKVTNAYTNLIDPEKRAHYDRFGP